MRFLGLINIIFCLFFLISNAHAFSLKLDPSAHFPNIPNAQESIEKYFSDIESILPASIKNELGTAITINFRKINPDHTNTVIGLSSKNNTITLNQDLIYNITHESLKSIKDKAGHHSDDYQFALATLIHEIIHQYDYHTKLSNDPALQALIGDNEYGFLIKHHKMLNQKTDRSIDPYEFFSAKESLAVNSEYFLLDPNYKCRKPTFYSYLATQFDYQAFSNSACQINTTIPTVSAHIAGEADLTNLDVSRLYQVHYLFAGKGPKLMSKWGHAMYRLVFCAPGKAMGPRCLYDTAYHFVVSYRAEINDPTGGSLGGIIGKYPSKLFLIPMSDVVNEYTEGDLRELISLPLKITEEQKSLFFYRVLEQYWAYEGKYLFFSNNCATEAVNLLRVLFPDDKEVLKLAVLHPLSFYQKLIKMNLIDDKLLSNLKEAKNNTYYYPSLRGTLEDAWNTINKLSSQKAMYKSMDEFAKKSKAKERQELFANVMNNSSIGKKSRIIIRFKILEDHIIQIAQKDFLTKLTKQVTSSKQSKEKYTNLLNKYQSIYSKFSPSNYISKKDKNVGYGIPLVSEFTPPSLEELTALKDQLVILQKNMKNLLLEEHEQEITEMQNSINNKAFYLNELMKAVKEGN